MGRAERVLYLIRRVKVVRKRYEKSNTYGPACVSVECSMTPRTHIRDAVLRSVTEDHPTAVVEAIEDCGVSATEAACLSRHALLDFDEYRQVRGGSLRRDVAAERENIA